MSKRLACFCTSEIQSHPVCVDPTFNFGKFEVTPFSYKHLFMKSERTTEAPVFSDRQLYIIVRQMQSIGKLRELFVQAVRSWQGMVVGISQMEKRLCTMLWERQ